jgi:hypothetical protein
MGCSRCFLELQPPLRKRGAKASIPRLAPGAERALKEEQKPEKSPASEVGDANCLQPFYILVVLPQTRAYVFTAKTWSVKCLGRTVWLHKLGQE